MTLTRKCGIIKVSIAEIGENIDVRIEENNKSNLAMKKVIR